MSTIFRNIKKIVNPKLKSCLIFLSLFFILLIPIISNSLIIQTKAVDAVQVDYIFSNANIITVDESNPLEEAIAIKDGKIYAIGTSEEILANYVTEEGYTLHSNGHTIIPGLIDGHTHLMWSANYGGYETLQDAQAIAIAYGYTTLNEKGADGWDRDIQPILDIEANGELRIRLNVFPIYNYAFLDENNESGVVERWYPDKDPILDPGRKFRVPGIKIYSDGAGGNRGLPAMSVPYSPEALEAYQSSSVYGDLYYNQSVLNTAVKTIHDKGFSCAFHSMGDRSTETVLNAIEYALDGETNDNFRHQIEHNSFIREDLIAQALTLNTIHSVRGYFPTYWQVEYEEMFNETVLEWYVNRYSLPDEGLHSYLETDFTWQLYDPDGVSSHRTIKPFLHMWGLVTRKSIDVNGTIHSPVPWLAEHTISVEQALKMMTLEGAYAVKQEDYLGSLEVGKFADLIVLSDDPLTIDPDEIKGLEVYLTMINGTIEFQNPGRTIFSTLGSTGQFGPSLSLSIISMILGFSLILGMTLFKKKSK
ncbi:MAG: amidohydrolase family protein [Candidatus Heimdallarchaeota archaeon]|nr:amidohydrolase family protein [Candidatus Heimdallarchaeota archaeon]MCG3253807.1 amidohydrolase family protein [Candidatus Heimdallarchaeota archaeon]MCK4290942.1 amidohydrolase family protein [Candidatus Heimdallarchaeota archaeon]